ncbi:MAG: 2-oxo acid dehydrogenase subunit E2 [Phycisphaerales bacterium]|nr:2-oxo acid dehydrogenase subunit E2 [Phycisphaerales bacterium]
MAELILMPRLSDTMTEGVIANWYKNVGDVIKKGDLLADIETDKATMELESYHNGVLLYQGAKIGGKIEVNQPLAVIGLANENFESLLAPYKNAQATTNNALAPEKNIQPSKQQDISPAPVATDKNYELILMPRLSDTMTEGIIANWYKKVGDVVKKGDILADIETDKATMELESYKNGVFLYQGAPQGGKIQVNELLCIIGEASVQVDEILRSLSGNKQVLNNITTNDEGKKNNTNNQSKNDAVAHDSVNVSADKPVHVDNKRMFISPLAKKMARDNNLDITSFLTLQGSGDHGRIIKADIENIISRKINTVDSQSDKLPAESLAPQLIQENKSRVEQYQEVPISSMRKTIAKRLSNSKFTAPHFYLTIGVNMTACLQARQTINQKYSSSKISVNDIIVKAVASALIQHPKVNSSWQEETIRINEHIHIGVALAVDEGLLVPVVKFANTLSLQEISTTVKDFSEKAKKKKLQPNDWSGNTFTISNLGMYGIKEFTAIINPPDACILAVGGIEKIPAVKDNQIIIADMMNLTLSCDHRVVDGVIGSKFLNTLKEFLENPLLLFI